MPAFWLSRIQRWLLHPHTCPEHAWGHPHTYGGCPNLSPSVTMLGAPPHQALFGCPVAHSNCIRQPLSFI